MATNPFLPCCYAFAAIRARRSEGGVPFHGWRSGLSRARGSRSPGRAWGAGRPETGNRLLGVLGAPSGLPTESVPEAATGGGGNSTPAQAFLPSPGFAGGDLTDPPAKEVEMVEVDRIEAAH